MPRTTLVGRSVCALAFALVFTLPVLNWPVVRAATQNAGADDWVFLGTVTENAGTPTKWLGDAGFVFADAASKDKVVPKLGDRIQLTTVKEIRTTNAQGQLPFWHEPIQGDLTGEFQPGTVLTVTGIGSRSMSTAGDQWQCWVRVQQSPLPCVPAAPNDPAPWEHDSRVLQSFQPDVPPPSFLGRFRASSFIYELHLWRDSKGLFGEWLSPVLPADPPISRLYDLRFDVTSGALSFETRIRGRAERFEGQFDGNTVRGTVTQGNDNERIVLRQLPRDDTDDALRELTRSRAQFECEMILFHRY